MKHIELIKLIYENRDILDSAYRQEHIASVKSELLDINLFIKINDSYKLNQNYLNFVDSLLSRVDYSIIFGDYEKEYKELVKLKKRYSENGDDYYMERIIDLVQKLYHKFKNRDLEIKSLIIKLESETSLDIDILLENANDTLDKIYELIDANKKIGHFFRETLRGVSFELDTILQSISVEMLMFVNNIDTYIKQIKHFIVQTKNRRLQNRLFMSVANDIVDEKTQKLEEVLSNNSKYFYFSVSVSQKNTIKYLADDVDILRLKKPLQSLFENMSVKKAINTSSIKPQKIEKLNIVNTQNIIDELDSQKTDDVFVFIKEHKELSIFKDKELIEESFKIYLHISVDKRLRFMSEFNEFGVKVASWQ